jgi:hypothetical protein
MIFELVYVYGFMILSIDVMLYMDVMNIIKFE